MNAMKKLAGLLSGMLLLSACADSDPPCPPEQSTTSSDTSYTGTPAPPMETTTDGRSPAYALLSQYLEKKPESTSLVNCRMLGDGAYLLCFEKADHSYEIEYTTLSHGKEIYTISDGAAYSAADGFWVLSQASESTAAAMEWQGYRYQRLSVYRDSLSLEAYVDITPFGKVDAFAVDIGEQRVYAAKHTTAGVQLERMGFFERTPEVVSVLTAAAEPYVTKIGMMHVGGELLLFVGEACENGGSVPCFGSFSLRRESVWLHTRKGGGAFAIAPYDAGAYFYDAQTESGLVYRIGDAKDTELKLGTAAESLCVASAQSGAYFATGTVPSEETVELTVYDAQGGRITKSVSQEALSPTSEIRMYFDEDARRLLYSVTGKDWKEILY